MKRKPVLYILITIFFAVVVVLKLNWLTYQKNNFQYTGFNRTIIQEALQGLDTLNLRYDSYYIAGADSLRIFLGNRIAFARVLEINLKNIKDTVHHKLKAQNIKYKTIQLMVDPPSFYLVDGKTPFIYKGNIMDWVATPYVDSIHFTRALPLTDTSLALLKIHNLKNTFYKITQKNNKPDIYPNLLEEQHGEGIFSTDGKLYYDKQNKQLVFVYYYRNQYLCMDIDFKLLYKGNTIDTISEAKIKVEKINSGNSLTMSQPPLTVNKKHCISNNYLYIHSGIPAQNENMKKFKNASVIDVYNLKNGSYQFSYYIPAYKGNPLKEFIVIHNDVVVSRYKQHIILYKLTPMYFGSNESGKNIIAMIRDKDRKPV